MHLLFSMYYIFVRNGFLTEKKIAPFRRCVSLRNAANRAPLCMHIYILLNNDTFKFWENLHPYTSMDFEK